MPYIENWSSFSFPALNNISYYLSPSFKIQASSTPINPELNPPLMLVFLALILPILLIGILYYFWQMFSASSTYDQGVIATIVISMAIALVAFIGFSGASTDDIKLFHDLYSTYIIASVAFLSITFAGFAIIANMVSGVNQDPINYFRGEGFFQSRFFLLRWIIVAPTLVIMLSLCGFIITFSPPKLNVILFSVATGTFTFAIFIFELFTALFAVYINDRLAEPNDED